ncbi:MAG: sigma-54 interaction domain-containing protein [bacterium]
MKDQFIDDLQEPMRVRESHPGSHYDDLPWNPPLPEMSDFESGFMIGKSQAMLDVFELIDQAAQNSSTVLVTGETGTGKDLAARHIHQRSSRRENPFVIVDCASIPRELMENELYGHEKGAYTGAHKKMLGKIEVADGGSVFFDDIDCMPLDLQAKLLRVLQERKFERVGGVKTISINTRFIFASNQDLKAKMQKGTFREDLYYRINVIPIYVPPLRERQEDIYLLTKYFLEKFSYQRGKNLKKVSPKTKRYLMRYSWPGNIRELENEMERIVSLAKRDLTTLTPDLLSEHILEEVDVSTVNGSKGLLNEAVESLEKRMLCAALKRFHGNKTAAAKYLGLSRRGINKKLQRYRMIDASCTMRS